MAEHSDALVFFGATGDLAYKQIFPALAALIAKGKLDLPIVGVAKQGWNLDQLKQRARVPSGLLENEWKLLHRDLVHRLKFVHARRVAQKNQPYVTAGLLL